MLQILGRKTSSNVQKVLWCCAELAIPFEREDVGGPFGGNDTPQYLAQNPNGLVPTIIDEGFVLWESNAIVRYLAAKHGRGTLYPGDDTLTMGDIALGNAVHRWFRLPRERPALPHVEAYYARLNDRAPYRTHVSGV